jgi:hypothetical protein
MIKSRKMRGGRACSTNGEEEECTEDLVGKPEGKKPIEDQDVGGWIILKWVLNTMGWHGLD